jgi:hypothetical protein
MNLHEEITKLQTATKRGELPREVRLIRIEELTETYFAKTGELPDAKALERLADLCLYEELTDPNEHKVMHNEYPILSETQIARRQEGKHTRKNDNPKIEVPFSIASNVGVDGRNHNMPTRRERSDRENSLVDKEARSINLEIKKAYNAFVNGKTSGLFTVNISTGLKTLGGDVYER